MSKLKSPSNQMCQCLRLVTSVSVCAWSPQLTTHPSPACLLPGHWCWAGAGNQYSVLTKNVRGVNRPSWLPGPSWADEWQSWGVWPTSAGRHQRPGQAQAPGGGDPRSDSWHHDRLCCSGARSHCLVPAWARSWWDNHGSQQPITHTPHSTGVWTLCGLYDDQVARWPGAPPSLSGVARRLQAACCLHPVAPLSPGLQCPQVPVPTQPMAAAHCWPPQDAPLYCTVQHCTALYCTVQWSHHTLGSAPHMSPLHTAGTGSCTGTDTAHTQ